MKWTLRLLLLLALFTAGSLAVMVTRQRQGSPAELLAEVRDVLAAGRFEERIVLRRLEDVVALARKSGDDGLLTEALSTRADLLLSIGATGLARRDYQELLAGERPGAREIRRRMVQVDVAEGRLEAGLSELRDLIRDEPDFVPAWIESGRLNLLSADELLERCRTDLALALVEEDAQAAFAIVTRLSAQDPLDPARATGALALRDLVPAEREELAARVLVLSDQASAATRRARQAFVRSFTLDAVEPQAVAGLMRILIDAGRSELAVDFGLLATSWPAVAEHVPTAALLIRALLDRQDYRRASEQAGRWLKERAPLSADFLHLLCEGLYRGKDWRRLRDCSNRLKSIGTAHDVEVSQMYMGFAQAGEEQPERAAQLLRAFALGRVDEPLPGLRAEAWRQIALMAREAGRTSDEHEALHEALRLDPDLDGHLWLRLSELQLERPHTGIGIPLASWTSGMCLLPRTTAENLPRFEQLGRRLLQAGGEDVLLLHRDLTAQGQILPRHEASLYELYLLAQIYAGEGRSQAAETCAQEFLDRQPGFIPVIDILIDALIEQGRLHRAALLTVERLEAVGRDERNEELLAALPAAVFDGAAVVRMMAADPATTGRLAVARDELERGQTQAALEVLRHGPERRPGRAELWMLGETLVAQGAQAQALAVLTRLDWAGPGQHALRRAALSAAVHEGRTELVERALEAAVSDQSATSADLRDLAALLLRLGDPVRAGNLLRVLDRPGEVDGQALLERALCALAAGELDAAQDALERAEAFVGEELAGVARLQLVAARGDWRAAASVVGELRAGGEPLAGLLEALFALLSGARERALELAAPELAGARPSLGWILVDAAARLGQAQDPLPPSWLGRRAPAELELFALGPPGTARDPRELAALLVATETPGFEAFCAGVLHRLGAETHGELWPRLLEARSLFRLGERAQPEQILWRLSAGFPDCDPVWAQLEEIVRARVKVDDHPQVSAFMEYRLRTRGEAEPESEWGLLYLAQHERRAGDLEGAHGAVLAALELCPGWREAQAELALVLGRRGDSRGALALWRAVCIESPARGARPWVPDLLAALGEAEAAQPSAVTPGEVATLLADLQRHLPDDPRVALALAERDRALDPRNPAMGVARAFLRLETFRAEHAGRTLEGLQPGAADAWAAFYRSIDPEAARAFLESEREREPANLELWLQLGRLYRLQDDLRTAVRILIQAGRMSPDARIQREVAATYAAAAMPPSALRDPLRAAGRADESEGTIFAALIEAQSGLRQSSPRAWAAAIKLLAPLWEERAALSDREQRAQLGELLALGLMLRNDQDDPARAREVLSETRALVDDPYRSAVLGALEGIAAQAPRPAD